MIIIMVIYNYYLDLIINHEYEYEYTDKNE